MEERELTVAGRELGEGRSVKLSRVMGKRGRNVISASQQAQTPSKKTLTENCAHVMWGR
jgi:hypothetical protein